LSACHSAHQPLPGAEVGGVFQGVHKEVFDSKSLAQWFAARPLDATTILGSPWPKAAVTSGSQILTPHCGELRLWRTSACVVHLGQTLAKRGECLLGLIG